MIGLCESCKTVCVYRNGNVLEENKMTGITSVLKAGTRTPFARRASSRRKAADAAGDRCDGHDGPAQISDRRHGFPGMPTPIRPTTTPVEPESAAPVPGTPPPRTGGPAEQTTADAAWVSWKRGGNDRWQRHPHAGQRPITCGGITTFGNFTIAGSGTNVLTLSGNVVPGTGSAGLRECIDDQPHRLQALVSQPAAPRWFCPVPTPTPVPSPQSNQVNIDQFHGSGNRQLYHQRRRSTLMARR